LGRGTQGTGVFRQTDEFRHRSEHIDVGLAVVTLHYSGVSHPIPAMFSGSSSGPSACDQRLSLRPSQNSHGLYAAAAIGIVRLEPTPIPSPTFLPSWNCRSGSWQVLQATAWLRLK